MPDKESWRFLAQSQGELLLTMNDRISTLHAALSALLEAAEQMIAITHPGIVQAAREALRTTEVSDGREHE